MAILVLARLIGSLLSILILVAAGYLLWSWYDGSWFQTPDGDLIRTREAWRLWTGAGLAAWSMLGGMLAPLLLAKPGRSAAAPVGKGALIPGVSGSTLYVEQSGPPPGPVLVLTHGWGMDHTFWNDLRESLKGQYRVVTWDLPGLGRSKPPPGGEISVANFAADLSGLVSSLEGDVILVGHSIGGMTVQTLVRDHPQALARVSGVVLLNTTYANPLKTMIFSGGLLAIQKPVLEPMMRLTVLLHPLVWLSKWQSYLSGSTHMAMRLGFGRTVTMGQLRHTALLATRAPPAIEAKGDLAMFHWDATGVLQGIETPVLVVGGNLDIVTKAEASRVMAGDAPSSRLQLVEGANHMGPMEQSDRYAQLISTFVDSVLGEKPARGQEEAPVLEESGAHS